MFWESYVVVSVEEQFQNRPCCRINLVILVNVFQDTFDHNKDRNLQFRGNVSSDFSSDFLSFFSRFVLFGKEIAPQCGERLSWFFLSRVMVKFAFGRAVGDQGKSAKLSE